MNDDEELLSALNAKSIVPVDKAPWEIADKIDEDQIVSEITGQEGISDLVYSFTGSDGKREVGLTWSGVKAVVRNLTEKNKIKLTIDEVQTTVTTDAYVVIVKCRDLVTNQVYPGGAEQLLVSDRGKRDVHAFPKALSKAIRNAYRYFIPEEVIKSMVKQFLDERMKKKTGGR